jgi:hypothetical protein
MSLWYEDLGFDPQYLFFLDTGLQFHLISLWVRFAARVEELKLIKLLYRIAKVHYFTMLANLGKDLFSNSQEKENTFEGQRK